MEERRDEGWRRGGREEGRGEGKGGREGYRMGSGTLVFYPTKQISAGPKNY